jgi:hypothetical protein
MPDMLHRALIAAAIAVTTLGLTPVAHADPPPCPASGCPHGPAVNAPGPPAANAPGPVAAPGPPPANVNSPSYKDAYKTEHDYFGNPRNHAYLASEMSTGYTAALACQVEVQGGTPPANLNDWIAGCIDALHDLGFKP